MTGLRRYDDEEVHRIFEIATEARAPGSPGTGSKASGEGLTLAELQEIGAEAGIDAALVARAAASLETSVAVPAPVRQFGIPVSVAHEVDLPAPLSDEDWDRFVVHLREVFNARGSVSREGSLRSWSNGNLQVLMEPTTAGFRLRMRSLSSRIRGNLGAGLGLSVMGGVVALSGTFAGVEWGSAFLPLMGAFVVGAGMFASGVAGSSRWTARRRAQFEQLGAQAVEIATRRLGEGGPPPPQ